MRTLLYWAPRLIAMAGTGFIALFALDAVQPGTPLAGQLAGLAIHLIPSAVLVAILLVAWRFEQLGGCLFLAVSLVPLTTLGNPPWVNLVLGAPFFLAGLLFILDHHQRR